MTDKQKIRAEVERLKMEYDKESIFRTVRGDTAREVFGKLLSFIDSIPEEPGFGCEANFTTKEELEKEFNRFLDNVEGTPRMWHSDEQMEWALDIARHFANWQKKQMMNEIWHKGSDNPGNKHPYPVINPDTQEMAFAYYDQRFGMWEFDRDYNPGRNMLWLDIEKILPDFRKEKKND